jgi:hypothetical protein
MSYSACHGQYDEHTRLTTAFASNEIPLPSDAHTCIRPANFLHHPKNRLWQTHTRCDECTRKGIATPALRILLSL